MNNDLEDQVKKVADEKGIQFSVFWRKLLMERFLARLARSPHTDKFIFKGGFLLSCIIEIGRETKDLDFALTRMKAGKDEIKSLMDEITSVPSHDGFVLSFDSIEELSQPHMNYVGYRVTLKASIGRKRDSIKIDLGIGDIVAPKQYLLGLSRHDGGLFFESEEFVSLLVYPIETIFAEKLETVVSKGFWNTRVKDYHDLFLILKNRDMINYEMLKEDIKNTFKRRNTTIQRITFKNLNTLQTLWGKHRSQIRHSMQNVLALPSNISEIILELNKIIEMVV